MSTQQILLAFVAAGCLSTGCESEGPRCDEQSQVFSSLTQQTPTGMSGASFTADIVKDYPIVFQPAKLTPEGTPTPTQTGTLSLRLVPGAAFTHTVSTQVPCTGRRCPLLALTCVDWVSIPVTATLVVPDQGIQETWTGELRGYDPADPDIAQLGSGPQVRQPYVHLKRPASEFQGGLKIPAPQPAQGNTKLVSHDVGLEIRFDKGRIPLGEVLSYTQYEEQSNSNDASVALGRHPVFRFSSPAQR